MLYWRLTDAPQIDKDGDCTVSFEEVLGPGELYHFDIESMTVIMEFLDTYELLEKGLIAKGTVNESVAKAIANFMARTHAAAHSMPPGGKPGGKPTEPSEGNCTSSHMPPHEHWFMTLVLLM